MYTSRSGLTRSLGRLTRLTRWLVDSLTRWFDDITVCRCVCICIYTYIIDARQEKFRHPPHHPAQLTRSPAHTFSPQLTRQLNPQSPPARPPIWHDYSTEPTLFDVPPSAYPPPTVLPSCHMLSTLDHSPPTRTPLPDPIGSQSLELRS